MTYTIIPDAKVEIIFKEDVAERFRKVQPA
jgi:hypothetical protein